MFLKIPCTFYIPLIILLLTCLISPQGVVSTNSVLTENLSESSKIFQQQQPQPESSVENDLNPTNTGGAARENQNPDVDGQLNNNSVRLFQVFKVKEKVYVFLIVYLSFLHIWCAIVWKWLYHCRCQ